MLIRRAGMRNCLLATVVVAGLLVCSEHQVQAQGFGFDSFFSVKALECYIGPIFPKEGLCNSFRSELGTGYTYAKLVGAKLTGSTDGQFDLRDTAFLDENPSKYDFRADLRLWRLAARGAYSYFDTRSRHLNFGGLDFTGMRLGGGLDVVQLQWWTFGACGDFYFIDPRYRGVFLSWRGGPAPVQIDVTGSRPATWGLYLRYVPPEIIGIPVHLEAYGNFPLAGSRLTYYGASLVFRPQIYRFDIAAKVGMERTYLKFSQSRENALPSQNWEIDMEWDMFRFEVAAYF